MELTDAEVAVAAARAGAEVVARTYGDDQTRFAKSSTDFATQTDIDAETAILEVLSEHRPDDARIGEELGRSGSERTERRRCGLGRRGAPVGPHLGWAPPGQPALRGGHRALRGGGLRRQRPRRQRPPHGSRAGHLSGPGNARPDARRRRTPSSSAARERVIPPG
ncbi:inositol monophosphatase family protein [Agromyces sp. NPDC127015]|uniref:inositol monophosphatase family protein n=1 Tax=Agromyces sp. NPDC127015 TaxID=3347108 RepID=UPI0036487D37